MVVKQPSGTGTTKPCHVTSSQNPLYNMDCNPKTYIKSAKK